MSKIPLKEVITQLTDDLIAAHEHAVKRGGAVMQFEECEMEFGIEASKEGGGGAVLYFLNFTSKVSKKNSNTVKLTFKRPSGASPLQFRAEGEGEGPPLERQ